MRTNAFSSTIKLSLHQLTDCLSDRVVRRVGLWTGIAFLLLYLYSVGNIVIAPGVDLAFGRPIPIASVVSDWAAKMWKPISPFVWEPIVALYPIRSVALFISVPNVLMALLLGSLVGVNTAVAIARARLAAAAQRRGGFLRGFLASFPALLTGFTCCVPTIVLALGSLAAVFTVAAITMAPYFLPVAALALVGNVAWGLRKFSCALPQAQDQNRNNAFIHERQLRTKEG
jgi:hypothetical protein